jgi:hypothetical protein
MLTAQLINGLGRKLAFSVGMIGTTVGLASSLYAPVAQARSGHAIQDINKVYSMLQPPDTSIPLKPKTFVCYNNQNPSCKNPVRYSVADSETWRNYFQTNSTQRSGSGPSGGPSTGSPSTPGNTPGSSGSGGR